MLMLYSNPAVRSLMALLIMTISCAAYGKRRVPCHVSPQFGESTTLASSCASDGPSAVALHPVH